MGRRISDVIDEQEAKVLSLTVGELHEVWRNAWFAGHETSRYCPNLSGTCDRDFIQSALFDRIKETSNGS